LTATRCLEASTPAYTTPMPPAPRRWTNRYGPTRRGSSGSSGLPSGPVRLWNVPALSGADMNTPEVWPRYQTLMTCGRFLRRARIIQLGEKVADHGHLVRGP